MAIALLLYDKPGCHLCEAARVVVEQVRASLADRVATVFETFDIRRDPALLDLYRYEIPVLCVDGRPAFRHAVDAARLTARLVDGAPAPLEE